MPKIFKPEQLKKAIDDLVEQSDEDIYFITSAIGNTSISCGNRNKKINTTHYYIKDVFKNKGGIDDITKSNTAFLGMISIKKPKLTQKAIDLADGKIKEIKGDD